ncbi:MAG: hypothetical protein PWQ60_2469 [Thermoanaerobacteraceae bacterium]|nr:hypothetical protein [Thermoanaerobacteraceae bacterium]
MTDYEEIENIKKQIIKDFNLIKLYCSVLKRTRPQDLEAI